MTTQRRALVRACLRTRLHARSRAVDALNLCKDPIVEPPESSPAVRRPERCPDLPLLAHATPASDALQALTAQDLVSRSVSLKDLGITNPVVLDQADNRQAFFLPVPKGVAISDAQIELKGRFIKGEEMPATLRLSVDGQPRVAERVSRAEGDLGRNLAVDSGRHASGFVNFTLDWSSPVSEDFCSPPRATANVLTLSPETRLNYRYSMSALGSLAEA